MATSTLVPLSEYLTTSYEHDCEWVDGHLRERGMPDAYHSYIQTFFIGYFLGIRRQLGVRVDTELRFRVAERNYRIPDVSLLPADAPFIPIPTVAPILCIEVLSPDDRESELLEKIDDYLTMGIPNIWIVDPRRRTMSIADASGIHLVEELRLPGTPVRITPTELFSELDELEALNDHPKK